MTRSTFKIGDLVRYKSGLEDHRNGTIVSLQNGAQLALVRWPRWADEVHLSIEVFSRLERERPN